MDGQGIPRNILRLAEAFIFASSEPVTWKSLRPILPDQFDPVAVLEALQLHCADRGVVLVESGGVWAFRTATDLAAPLRAGLSETRRLPRVAMETVVVIALYQPLTRTDIEDIRGVAVAQGTMEELLETGLIEPWGRQETAGRPTLWVTTPRFLAQPPADPAAATPPVPSAPVSPEALAALAAAIDFAGQALAPATLRAYRSDWQHFCAWCRGRPIHRRSATRCAASSASHGGPPRQAAALATDEVCSLVAA